MNHVVRQTATVCKDKKPAEIERSILIAEHNAQPAHSSTITFQRQRHVRLS